LELYKGFIQTKNKKPLKEFKDGKNLISYDWARKLPEFAGVLNDGIVLVDVDDQHNSDIVFQIIQDLKIQCYVIDTTRGKHFLFQAPDDLTNNKIKTNTALGIKVDIKLGSKNSCQVLKHNGIMRRWIYKPTRDQLDIIPFWLKPVKHDNDFSALGEGDGRNQALFNYILTLQSAGFTKDEIRFTIKLINDYVLKEPLPEREINTILRDEAFLKQSFFVKNKFLHDEFAKYIQRENHIIKIDNVLHIYKDGVYSSNHRDIEAVMIQHIPQLKQAQRKEVLAYLELIAPEKEPAPVNLIALANGIYDLETDKLIDFSPDIIIKNKVPVDYVPDAYDENVDKVLDKITCNDKELRHLLEEMVGYLLFRRNELRKCFILIGDGQNGKSTFIDMLKKFLGEENYSSLALEELGHRFKTAEVFGKLANLGDDISSQYIDNNAVFKKLVTGETVNVERKGKDPFEFRSYAKMIFAANTLPRINDTSDGLISRLIIIPFNAKFSPDDPDFDPFIKDKLLTESAMQYLLRLGLHGLKRILNQKQFTMPDVVKRELRQYEVYNNPVMAWLEEGQKVENEPTADVHRRYQAWCYDNGLKPLGPIPFSREVCKRLNLQTKLTRINGRPVRVFKAK